LSLRKDLIRLLGQLATDRSEIKLLNIYKGLPITCNTGIRSVGDSEISVPASRQHMACLYYQRETYLQSDKLPFPIRSLVISLNLGKGAALLANFEVAKANIGKRARIRVEPDEPLLAFIQLTGSGYELPAPLSDISAEGAGFYLETDLFPVRKFQPGSEALVSVLFPDQLSQKVARFATKPMPEIQTTKPLPHAAGWQDGKLILTARGRVASVLPEPELDRYRIGMQLDFQNLARTVIHGYISQRQAEIIRELRVLSDELYSRVK